MEVNLFSVTARTIEGLEIEVATHLRPDAAADLAHRLAPDLGEDLTGLSIRRSFWLHINRGHAHRRAMRRIGSVA